jgi:hypothetical protein
MIRLVQEQDYEKVAQLMKYFFKTHTVFKSGIAEIVRYLKIQKDELVLNEQNNEIKAALFFVKTGSSETHTRWKFRHFAFTSAEFARQLLKRAEEKAQESSTTSKIEQTIAETERGVEFYKSHGYQLEGH